MNNTLLNIEEIRIILDRDFIPLESFVTGLRLKKQVEMETNVEQIERRLKVKLPVDFVNLILNYDFGDFSILGVHFGSNTNYIDKLISYHEHLSNEEIKNFSNQFITIAMGDYFTFIMDVNCGSIYVYGSETSFNKKIKVAETFTKLIQTLGTAYFHSSQNTQTEFLDIVIKKFDEECINFWKEIIN
ncbi:SMI1/KNR4 family protein [Lysinibacillus sp. CD3-6]|uniref:SMI1/KNR4 family protein n=1 Tax=Lysinibacillus sp. CD3-6 TaxID=2892541 RepID=UPI00116B0947|nr:SMI1/KNR4 family protein [Lysinibacillus sp. CD3-6]UED78794.1 SMI1/KNR4 family protein [Lysinibacillus sp. CD3-6]